MIRAGPDDRAAVERLLEARPERAMFPLANLRDHGTWDDSDHPRAMRFWIDRRGRPRAALGLSREGMAMPVGPAGHVRALVPALAGRTLMGFAGGAEAVRAAMAAAGVAGAPAELDADEPQYRLSLRALGVPKGQGALAPLSLDPATAVRWRMAYDLELHVTTGEAARTGAEAWVAQAIKRDGHRFLAVDGRPVAMTGFNARLASIVQVGGVYVPPDGRGRGLAGRAVALHLSEARRAGAETATLFAASARAARTYERLGFGRIGDYALVLFRGRPVAGGVSA